MIAHDEVLKIVKICDQTHQQIRESDEDYHAQIREMSKHRSLALDADLARAQKIITSIRRDLEKAREET